MNTTTTPLDPPVPEFETQEQADRYDRWFRAKVQEALDDPRPGIPHDEAMARVDRLVEKKKQATCFRLSGLMRLSMTCLTSTLVSDVKTRLPRRSCAR